MAHATRLIREFQRKNENEALVNLMSTSASIGLPSMLQTTATLGVKREGVGQLRKTTEGQVILPKRLTTSLPVFESTPLPPRPPSQKRVVTVDLTSQEDAVTPAPKRPRLLKLKPVSGPLPEPASLQPASQGRVPKKRQEKLVASPKLPPVKRVSKLALSAGIRRRQRNLF